MPGTKEGSDHGGAKVDGLLHLEQKNSAGCGTLTDSQFQESFA